MYWLTLLLLAKDSHKWNAGIFIFTPVQQLLWLLLLSILRSTNSMYMGLIPVSPFTRGLNSAVVYYDRCRQYTEVNNYNLEVRWWCVVNLKKSPHTIYLGLLIGR